MNIIYSDSLIVQGQYNTILTWLYTYSYVPLIHSTSVLSGLTGLVQHCLQALIQNVDHPFQTRQNSIISTEYRSLLASPSEVFSPGRTVLLDGHNGRRNICCLCLHQDDRVS